MAALVPQDILRRRLLRMAPSPECYLTLRASFARSLAATCVTGYLLGVGDRHLENLLLDTTSGALVPIDFGTCFGIGASLLPVPELIPFRLTATLRGVLLPLDGQGLLRHYMVQALTRLRAQDSAGLLADRLEVYVRDPVMDWIRESEKENAPALAENKDWEPRRRVESARRKLKGIHPAALMAEDLAGNMAVKQFKSFAKLKEALDAAAPGAEQNTQLTPVQQVEALLRLATDEQISMLSYVGLNLFL
jgi:DNA-dependent protein kinase catalytic subunit